MSRETLGIVVAVFFILTLSALSGFAQERKALTLDGIIHLVQEGASPARISQLIEQYGVAFESDDRTLRQLKQAGASEAVLSTVKKMSARYRDERQRSGQLDEMERKARLERERQEKEAEAKAERARQAQEAKARAEREKQEKAAAAKAEKERQEK